MAEMTARLDHVGLAVADLGAAAAWYCDDPEGNLIELLHRPGRPPCPSTP